MTILTTEYDSPLGTMLLAADTQGLTGAWFIGQKYFASTLENKSEVEDLFSPEEILVKAKAWLDLYFAHKKPALILPLHLEGTAFRLQVWELLMSIPYGKTVTYGELAKKLESLHSQKKVSPRAVGGAVGHNPVSVIVPCHRVIGAQGVLTGYAGGLKRKQELLALEKRLV